MIHKANADATTWLKTMAWSQNRPIWQL